MRKAVVLTVLAVWVAILGTCQVLSCAPLTVSQHSCCPKHQAPKTPCPHDLLEKSKVSPQFTDFVMPVAVAPVILPTFSDVLHPVVVSTRLPNLAGLYLRNRILLI